MATVKELTMLLEKQLAPKQKPEFSVYVVTWNVASRFPDNISLRNLLDLEKNSDGSLKRQQLPDIYAIGFQEVNMEVKQQMKNIFFIDPWTKKLNNLLHELDYVTIQREHMQGLLLYVFIKRQHVPLLRYIEGDYTRTGFGGLWGNKGAISLRFSLYDCELVFVEAHLAAHDEHLNERIEDYKQILDDHHYKAHCRQIHDHDYIWWFGDLNFRLHGDDSAEEIRDAVLRGDTKELFERDQLNYMRLEKKEIFELLHEEIPTFPPTFKFKEGTSEYDMKRRPAWTDRILYGMQTIKPQPNKQLAIKQIQYRSHPEYTMSDHKPVSGEFIINFPSDYNKPCIEFSHINTWTIEKENLVHYLKPRKIYKEGIRDWIGVYPVNFRHLRDYVGYECIQQEDSSSSSEDEFREQLRMHERRHKQLRVRKRVTRDIDGSVENVYVMFDDDLKMEEGQLYKLIYFHCSRSHRGPSGIVGMSNEFVAVKNPDVDTSFD